MLNYPISVLDEEDGVTLTFPDVPEAITCGACIDEAMEHAADALLTAFMIYEKERRAFPIPKPRSPSFRDSTPSCNLPMGASLKIFLHNAMIDSGMRKVDLARKTGWANAQVDRILDPRYASKVDLIETALFATGKSIQAKLINL